MTTTDPLAFLEAVRADAKRGPTRTSGGLDAVLRDAVFSYACARALGEPAPHELPADVRAFVDAVLERPLSADVEALKRGGRSEDFVYELAIVAAVAAGTARGRRGLSLVTAHVTAQKGGGVA